MKPAITNIIFHGEDTAERRSVTAVLEDGHSVTITPLTSLGQKTFHQGGATMDRLRATVSLAHACVPWLHGDGPRPALRRFLSKANGEKAAEYRAARSKAEEAQARETALATDILAAFILRHGRPYASIDVREYAPATGNNITVILEDGDHSYPAWYGEALESIGTVTRPDGREDVLLNGKARLSDGMNRPIADALVEMAERIERDIADGKASFTDNPFPGTLEYKE